MWRWSSNAAPLPVAKPVNKCKNVSNPNGMCDVCVCPWRGWKKTWSFLFIEHANFSIIRFMSQQLLLFFGGATASDVFFLFAYASITWIEALTTKSEDYSSFIQIFFAHNEYKEKTCSNKWPLLVTIDTHLSSSTNWHQLNL